MKKVISKNKITTIDDAYEMFKTAKMLDDGNAYEVSLRVFKRDMQTELLESISRPFLSSWVNVMRKRGLTDASVNHHLTGLRVFSYWCMENGLMEHFKISLIHAQEPPIKFFSEEELHKLVERPKSDDFVEWRTYVIICFILSTGARAGTIVDIKKSDVDFKNKEVTYRHLKNKKLAIIPMTQYLCGILLEYISMFDTSDSEYLFCDCAQYKLTVSGLRQALLKYCKKRNVEPRGPHALRHSFSRQFIKNGGNAFTLQQFLTHSTLDMTKRYVRLFSEDLRNEINECSPLNKLRRIKR